MLKLCRVLGRSLLPYEAKVTESYQSLHALKSKTLKQSHGSSFSRELQALWYQFQWRVQRQIKSDLVRHHFTAIPSRLCGPYSSQLNFLTFFFFMEFKTGHSCTVEDFIVWLGNLNFKLPKRTELWIIYMLRGSMF